MARLFRDSFGYGDGVITNEFATHNPAKPKIHVSPAWLATSGSLFARNGQGYSGVPDANPVDVDSAKGNNSAIYRVITKRDDFLNIEVQFDLQFVRFVTTPKTPATSHDGVHVFLRRQGTNHHHYRTYYVSVFRRDGTSIIKKKPSLQNDNYVPLGPPVLHRVSPGALLRRVQASCRTNADGSVALKLYVNGVLLAEAVDPAGRAPLLLPGAVGLRADNCEFRFGNFEVHSLEPAGRGEGERVGLASVPTKAGVGGQR